MKRPKETYPNVKIIKPFFWRECRFCGREFKREKGFEIVDYTRVNAYLYSSYCCNECADSIEKVKELVKKSKITKPPRIPGTKEKVQADKENLKLNCNFKSLCKHSDTDKCNHCLWNRNVFMSQDYYEYGKEDK